MNAFKLLLCDIREGIIKNKRYLIIPILALFQCMNAGLKFDIIGELDGVNNNPATFFDLVAEIFHGCDPMLKMAKISDEVSFPFFWIAIFIFVVFVSFDYMHNDLTQFGIQVITRSKKRSTWWTAKCMWCLASSVWCYILFLATVLIFSAVSGYEVGLSYNPDYLSSVAANSRVFIFTGLPELSAAKRICMLLSPMLVICTLNMIQMLMCLLFKPMYSYLAVVGVVLAGVITDVPIAFSRLSMTTMSDWFFKDGYPVEMGAVICLVIISAAIIAGIVYFRRYDILPDKE